MTATRVQSVNNDSATNSVTITITTPTAGNLLIAGFNAAAGDQSTMAGPAGFTRAVITDSITSGASAIFWRIADGTEGTSLTFSGSGTATYCNVNFTEWSSPGTWPTSPVDAVGFTNGVSGTTATVTASAATTQAEVLAYAFVGLSGTSGGWLNTWTNGFAQNSLLVRTESATKQTTATEILSTTETWTTARVPRAAIAAFKLPAVSSGPATPTGLTATAVSSSAIDVTWNPVTGATGYDSQALSIFSGDDPAAIDWTGVPFTSTTATSFSDTGLSAPQRRAYRVRAAN